MYISVCYPNGAAAAKHDHLGLTEIEAATLDARARRGDQDAIAEVSKRMNVVITQLVHEPARGNC